MITRILLCCLLFSSFLLSAEDGQEVSMKAKLKQLVELRQKVLDAENDKDRIQANAEFLMFMRDALNHPNSFITDFDTIPMIGDMRSGDGYFRMVNWNLPFDDQTNRYYCFVQYFDKKENINKVIELKRGYRDLEGEYRKIFSEKDWYGALYYKIIPSKASGRKKRKRAYMLLGWDGKDQYSSLKVIDVMTITKRGLKFGDDIFDYPYESKIKRFIIEYKADASVSMNYDAKRKRIVFNHLVPMQPDLEGLYEFYIPVLEFDAFEWRKRKWVFVENVELKAGTKDRIYNDPPEPQNIR